MLILALVFWSRFARAVRGEVLALRERDFVKLAEINGISKTRIIARHLIPNVMNTVMVLFSLQVGVAVIIEASLSFLGVGVPPPEPSWGLMMAQARDGLMEGKWWLSVFLAFASPCWCCRRICWGTGCAYISIHNCATAEARPAPMPPLLHVEGLKTHYSGSAAAASSKPSMGSASLRGRRDLWPRRWSACGKTTTCHSIVRLLAPSAGSWPAASSSTARTCSTSARARC